MLVCKSDFPWLKRYSALVHASPASLKGPVAGYEMALNFNGIPFELIPRSASEIKGKTKIQLLSVNETEQHKNPCCRLVSNHSGKWELTKHGMNLLDLLTY